MILSLHNVKKISLVHKESATPGTMIVEIEFTREDESFGRITFYLTNDAEINVDIDQIIERPSPGLDCEIRGNADRGLLMTKDEYRLTRMFLENHRRDLADEIICDRTSKMPIAAVYFNPVYSAQKDTERFLRILQTQLEVNQ